MERQPTALRLARFAEDQWGLVTRRQLQLAGLAPATIARLLRRGELERVAHGVFRVRGAPVADHLELRAAWLQLAPAIPAWERTVDHGVVSHRSAASLYQLGHLPADTHHFTLPGRRQSRRDDVRLHTRALAAAEWGHLRGLPVTRPARIAADLLIEHEDPAAVGHVIAEAIRTTSGQTSEIEDSLAPFSSRFGLASSDGSALLRWLLDLAGDPAPESQR